AIYSAVPLAICVIDTSRTIRYANPQLGDLTGKALEDLLGGTACGAFGCAHANDSPLGCGHGKACKSCGILLAITETFKTGKPCQEVKQELVLIRNEKPVRLTLACSTSLFKIKDETRMLICLQDVSEHTRRMQDAELQLKFQHIIADISKRFISLSAGTIESSIQITLQKLGELFLVDRSYLFRYSPDMKTMRMTHEWCAPNISPQIDSLGEIKCQSMPWWTRAMKTMLPLHIPNVNDLPPEAAAEKAEFQREEIQSIIAIPIRDTNNQLLGFLGFDTLTVQYEWPADHIGKLQITAEIIAGAIIRQRIQSKLREKERWLRLSQEHAKIGTWIYDVKIGNFQCVGRTAALFGIFREDYSMTLEEKLLLCNQDDRSRLERTMLACLQGKGPQSLEFSCIHPDGSQHFLKENISAEIDERGMASRLLGLVQDVSENKHYEQAIRASQEAAERANRAKTEFLSSMSHELRTPLNSILGYEQLLERDATIQGKQLEYIREIADAGNHLLVLISDILDMARIESGRVELSIEDIRCCTLLQECVRLMQPKAQEARIEIACHCDSTLTVSADRIRLKQILLNLLSNAIKYNHDGGSIIIKVSEEPGTINFSVEDSGQGIPEHRMKDLFTPFNRLGREAGSIQGTGIGLAFCKKLTEMMNGTISASSEPGKGSCFYLKLPAATKKTYNNKEKKNE
ncbi:MAG: PAS domain S-box protein, partial [Spirochaetaceae bacterium]